MKTQIKNLMTVVLYLIGYGILCWSEGYAAALAIFFNTVV